MEQLKGNKYRIGAAVVCGLGCVFSADVTGGAGLLAVLALACCTLAALLELEPGLLPLPVMGGVAVLLLCFGMAGKLRLGAYTALGILLALALWGLFGPRREKVFALFRRPVLLIFLTTGIIIWFVYAAYDHGFLQWDEFTFWGVACRMVKDQNMLYPGAPGNLGARAYLPGMMLHSYFFQLFGSWAEYKVLAAYVFLFLASFAACASLPKKYWASSVLVMTAAFLLPFFFSVLPAGTVSKVYLNAMGDIPLGLTFGGTFCLWLGSCGKKSSVPLTALALCMLTLIKDMGFAYSLILVGVIFIDLCVRQKKYTLSAFAKQLVPAVLLALPVLLCFVGWSRYVALTASIDKNSVGSAGVSYGGMLLGGLQQLLGIGRTEKFAQLMAAMAQAFFRVPVCLLGPGAAAVAVITLVNAAAFVCTPKGKRRRVVWCWLAFAAAFAAFYLFHLFLYHYNFSEVEALVLKDYDRYIGPYYMGWMLASLCLLGRTVAAREGFPRLSRVAVMGVTACVAGVFLWRGVPTAGFWNDLSGVNTLRREVKQRAEMVNPYLDWEDRVLIISQGDDETRWYYYNYELNATVVRGFGGTCRGADDGEERWTSTHMNIVGSLDWQLYTNQSVCTREGLEYYLQANDCNYLLVDAVDDYFLSEFGPMFSEELPEHMGEAPRLFRVEGQGSEMRFVAADRLPGEVPQ